MFTKITSDFIDENVFVRKDQDDDGSYSSDGTLRVAISGNKVFIDDVTIGGDLTVSGSTNYLFTTTGAVTSDSSGSFDGLRVTSTGWFDTLKSTSRSGIILPSSTWWYESGSTIHTFDAASIINKADYASGAVDSGQFKHITLTGDPSITEIQYWGYSGLGVIDVQEITSRAGCSYNDGRFRSSGVHINSSGSVQIVIDSHNDADVNDHGHVFSIAKFAKLLDKTDNPGLDGCCNPSFQEIFTITEPGNVAITGELTVASGIHMSGDLDMTGDILNIRDLTVTGTLTLDNNLSVNYLTGIGIVGTSFVSGELITGGNAIIRGNLTGTNLYALTEVTGYRISGWEGEFGHNLLVWNEISGTKITGGLIRAAAFSGQSVSGFTGSFNGLWAKSGQFTETLTISGNSVITGAENYEYVVRCSDGFIYTAGTRDNPASDANGWDIGGTYWDTVFQRNNFGFVQWNMGGATHPNFSTGDCAATCVSGETYLNFKPQQTGLYLLGYNAYFTGTIMAPSTSAKKALALRTIIQMRPSGEDYEDAKETGVKDSWIIHSGDWKIAAYVYGNDSDPENGVVIPISIVAPVYITGNVSMNVGYSEQATNLTDCGWHDCYARENCLTLRYTNPSNTFTAAGLIKSKGTGT